MPEVVAKRIDTKGGVLKHYDTEHARYKKGAEGRFPASPHKADTRREHEGDQDGNQMNIAILPSQERILSQVSNVIEVRFGLNLEHQPAHVGVKEALLDTIRIVIVIHMLVVAAMFTGPKENRILKRPSSENNREEPHDPVSLKG